MAEIESSSSLIVDTDEPETGFFTGETDKLENTDTGKVANLTDNPGVIDESSKISALYVESDGIDITDEEGSTKDTVKMNTTALTEEREKSLGDETNISGSMDKPSSSKVTTQFRAPELTKSKKYYCEVCFKLCATPSYVIDHLLVHTKEKPYSCKFCDKKFPRKSALSCHMEQHSGVKPYFCIVCNRRFYQRGTLTKHLEMHTGENRLSCPKCPRTFVQKHVLEKHLKVHEGKTFNCHICTLPFVFVGSLKKHIVSAHADIGFPTCPICQKTFVQQKTLDAHMASHKKKGVMCKMCPKGFLTHEKLEQHMLVHTGKKMYSCKLCHNKFADKTNLEKHFRIMHTRPFRCTVCPETFTNQGFLNIHLQYCHTKV